jgi:O-antigen ligase
MATALAVAAPLVPSERTELTGAALPAAMLWLLTALLWFAGAWLTRQPIRKLEIVDYLALALGAWIAASGVVMLGSGQPRATINAIWTWLSLIVAFFLFRQLLRSQREVRALCAVMIGLAVGLSIIAMHQTFIAYPAMRALYERDPEEALRQAGISAPPGTMQRKQFEDRLNSTEPNATFSLTNSLAGFIAPWLVVLIAVASSRRCVGDRKETRGLETLTTGLIALPLLICLLLTKSRSAWLATLLGIAAIALARLLARGQRPAPSLANSSAAAAEKIGAGRWPPAIWLLVAVIAMASALFAAVGIFDIDIVAQAGRSLAFRMEYWRATTAMIFDYPLWGIGVGNFQEYYTAYKLPQASETIADPHNFLLEIAANAGVPALLLFVATVAFAILPSGAGEGETAKPSAEPFQRAVPIGAALGIPLSLFAGMVTGFLPDVWPLLIGASVGGLAVWLLRWWVERGELPRLVLAIAGGVLLVNLLAAGGISFPGVAMTLWILLAILARGQRPAPSSGELNESIPGKPSADRWPPAMGALVAALLLAACYATAYRPVLARTRLSLAASDALAAGEVRAAIALAERAAAADPWSHEPHLQLAQMHHEIWLAASEVGLSRDDPHFRAFEQHAARALALHPRSAIVLATLAWRYREAADRTGDSDFLHKAVLLLEGLRETYPNDALGRAQLAWAYRRVGKDSEAAAEAAEALRLDQRCPHAERKLAQRRLFAEVTSEAQQARMPEELRTLDAEQWMHRLRKE